jgi:hypothetical protein
VLDKRTLARINDRPRGRGSAIYAALGIAAAVTVMAFLVSYALAAVVGAAGAFLLYKREAEARTARLIYNLASEAAAKFAAVQEACEALSGADKVWRIEGEAKDRGSLSSYGATLSSTEARSVIRSRSALQRCPASRRTWRSGASSPTR